MKKTSFISLTLAASIVLLVATSSCATIISGTSQSVAISSNPSSAQVSIDNIEKGLTPVIVNLKRSNRHIVKISLDGYHPYELNINKKVNGWIIGNIVLGGIIGLAVDAISGGMYKLSPDEINAELKANETNVTAFESKKDGISVFVTLKPNPNWVKIGQLEAMK